VLVVEDEPNIALWLEEMLGTLGYSVKVADTIAASFGIFAEDPAWPDLVLLDMTLPDGTGLEVYRTLRAARPSLPFIICSGYADTEQVSTIQEDGHKMLHKPFGQDELVLLMRQILAQAGHVGRQK
jgi:DNA-binding response OmpR family regulator